jgi:hypothetical protein
VQPRLVTAIATGVLVVTAAGAAAQSPAPVMTDHAMGSMAPMGSMATMASPAMGATANAAADLRTALDLKLGEHIILAFKATGAALQGEEGQFKAYGTLLNTNGTDLGAMIGSVYGQDAQDTFNTIWSAHNGYFVDYTTGVATGDTDMQDTAVKDLTEEYVPQFSDFIAGATGLPLDAVTSLITDHVLQTKTVVDAQAAKDWATAYDGIRTAYAHMQMIGDALAGAIVAQHPDMVAGDANTPAVDFRVALNQLLQEHLYLATFATDAALEGGSEETPAALDVLGTNGTDIGGAIGTLYGQDAQDAFNQIWSAHNGFFVDYTTGVATKDQDMQDMAVENLTTVYVPQFASFLAGATGLPEDALTSLITDHVLTTKAVVDAQAGDDAQAAAAADLLAAQHMQMIGDPLSAAIVAAKPDSFQ